MANNIVPMHPDTLKDYRPTGSVRACDIVYAETMTSNPDVLRNDAGAVIALSKVIAASLRKTQESGQSVEWGDLATNKGGDPSTGINARIQALLHPKEEKALPKGAVPGRVTRASGAGVFVDIGKGKNVIVPRGLAHHVELGTEIAVMLTGDVDPFGHQIAQFAQV